MHFHKQITHFLRNFNKYSIIERNTFIADLNTFIGILNHKDLSKIIFVSKKSTQEQLQIIEIYFQKSLDKRP